MMPILRVTLLSKEVQRKSTMYVEDAVLHHCSSYKSGDCTLPPPPGAPLSMPGPKSNGFGSGFPGATGGYNYKSSISSVNEPADNHGNGSIRVNNKNNSGNNSLRKHKSLHNNNDGQQVGDDDGNGDTKMGGNLGINPIEQFFVEAREELKQASKGKSNY
jgi:hypothetical protein